MDSLTTIGYYIYFAVYDTNTHKLLYTKYNFDYDLYKHDTGLTSTDKGVVFADFLTHNHIDYTKPYTVLSQYVKYFTPMTQQIIDYIQRYGFVFHNNYLENQKPSTNIPYSSIIANQFNMIQYTSSQQRIIQDYYYNTTNGTIYSKHNFLSDSYSNDFHVYGTKLAIFTDFLIRCINLSGVTLNFPGYGIVDSLAKYFDTSNNNALISYLNSYSVTSEYSNVLKSLPNIDFVQYGIDNGDLSGLNVAQLTEHYLFYGQFEQRIVKILVTSPTFDELVVKSTGSAYIFDKNDELQIGSCFLYNYPNNPTNVYLITCYHLIKDVLNPTILMASFELLNHNITTSTSTTIAFRIIGYDIYTDVLVCIYDPTIQYNINNNVDITKYTPVNINFQYKLQPSDTVYTYGNLEYQNNNSIFQGNVIDSLYDGGFKPFLLAYPDSILIQLYSSYGISGGPIIVKDTNNLPVYVGMMTGYISEFKQYSIGISGFQLNEIINNVIVKWGIYSVKYAFSPVKLNYYIKDGLSKKWLGVIASYFERGVSDKISSSLISFPYTGGMVITDFIIGFNFTEKCFITNPHELSPGTLQFNTILLSSNMYHTYLTNNKYPIVLKSITFFNAIKSEYSTLYIGKYSNQVSYSAILYGLGPISNFPVSDYINSSANIYPSITMEYYYYDGSIWTLTKEIINYNSSDNSLYSNTNYNTYIDIFNEKYYQHQLEFPSILVPFLHPYLDNEENKMYGISKGKVAVTSKTAFIP
jgi:hypothetical protein